jgi:hypothetical protein
MSNVSEQDSGRHGAYYTDSDVAHLLGITLGRLRNKLCDGSPLPPRIQPPGCRHRLWPCRRVHDWLDQFTISTFDRKEAGRIQNRRGRPTKQEERSRRR